MSAVWEYTSIALEILAFFFVTTDLYGERIMAARKFDGGDAIIGLVFNQQKLLKGINFLVMIPAFALLVWKSYSLANYFGFLADHAVIKFFLLFAVSLLATYPVMYLFFLLLYILLGMIAKFFSFWIKTANAHSLKKVMLPFGALLFLLSKAIVVFKLYYTSR